LKPVAALMAALAALLGWESLPNTGDPIQIASVPVPAASTMPTESPRPLAAWTNVVLARPLFAQDRRPKAYASGLPNRSSASDALPRLAGTVRSNDTLMAIFVPADFSSANPNTTSLTAFSPGGAGAIPGWSPPGGSHRDGATSDAAEKPVVVGRDGLVAGWTVVDIMDGAVSLERDGRSVTLRLSYANTPAAAHVAAAEIVVLHDKRTNPFLQP
jgi:hypothetical protein